MVVARTAWIDLITGKRQSLGEPQPGLDQWDQREHGNRQDQRHPEPPAKVSDHVRAVAAASTGMVFGGAVTLMTGPAVRDPAESHGLLGRAPLVTVHRGLRVLPGSDAARATPIHQ
jgi:hypothetical protein